MTREEAINVLKTDSCYECSWGCDSPVSCHCGGCDLAEATRIAIESLEVFEWVPVTERLPEDEEMKLVTCRTKKGILNVNRAYYMDEAWHGSGTMSGVVAWMELPEPYEEGSNE